MNLENYKKLPKNLKFTDLIIFENENYLVINKPPFISSLDERTSVNINSIIAWAKAHDENLQLCHRIDKETSGALVLSKNPEAYRNLAIQFEHRQVSKEYHAIACSSEKFEERHVDFPIARKKDGTAARIDTRKGMPAQTIFHTIESFRQFSLIRCIPITGRLHQIRVHLQYVKAPIVADINYGGQHLFLSSVKKHFNLKQTENELPLIKRVALHAFAISFLDINDNRLTIQAPYAKDFQVALGKLQKFK